MSTAHYSTRHAFSLVELSIVLVILGLLIGGILSGQSLIRAAELRSVSADLSRFSTSIYTFRDKYFALPGDMTNATSFWLSAGGTGSDATCQDTISTTAATCNGNGDGTILHSINYSDEGLRGWQHLANAGLIEGSYVGTNKNFTAGEYLARSVPRSKLSNSGYMLYAEALTVTGWTSPRSTPENLMRLGAACCDAAYTTRIGNPVIKAEEAWNIDTKIDDGKPGTGKLWVHGSGAGTCMDSIDAAASVYLLSNTTLSCLVHYSL
jgi:prepilin-type N-terminal cleavage/methylation domain-containing protein